MDEGDAAATGGAAMAADEALRRGWPTDESSAGSADQPDAARPFGPTFAWRARLLWALAAILGVLVALILVAEALANGISAPGLVLEAVIYGLSGPTFVAARRAVGGGRSWAATPSLVLGSSFVIGGLARMVMAIPMHTFLVPLEAIVGIWLLYAGDRPPWRLGRPGDWRTAAVVALAIAVELPSFAPLLPSGSPAIGALSSGAEAMQMDLHVQCPDPTALWERLDVEVDWQWRGFDLAANGDDRLTLSLSGTDAGLSWDVTDPTASAYVVASDARQMVVTIPRGRTDGQITSLLVQQGDSAPFTVTATLAHAGRVEVTRTTSCGG